MNYKRFIGPDGLVIRVPADEEYRTCAECGGDCVPEHAALDGSGVRIAFVCPEHGVHSVVDPFEDKRYSAGAKLLPRESELKNSNGHRGVTRTGYASRDRGFKFDWMNRARR